MKTENKYKWMVWAIVILALMNITTFLTILYNRNESGRPATVPEAGQIRTEVTSPQYSGRYFRDQLGLNNEQMNRFVEINPEFRQSVRTVNIELDRKRNRMFTEMNSKSCDTSRLNVLSDSIGILHADLKKLTYRYYMDLRDICNEQQKEKLGQMFNEIFAGDLGMGQYGRGGQQGRRRGWRFNN